MATTTKWVSLDKLRYAISKIYPLLQGKVDKAEGKGLSTNDLTAALKANYDAAYTHSQAVHAPSAAEQNVIVGVQVNGSDLTPSAARKVNVSVPTGDLANKSKVADTDLDTALKAKIDKIDGVEEGANKYVHPTTSGSKHIPSGGSSGQILRWSADGTAVWGADNDTQYTVMSGATASAAGTTGLVPAPAAGKQAQFLRGDGTWQTPTDTTYSAATQSVSGLMSATDKVKLDAFSAASNYALKSDITQMYRYKGSVTDASKLPSSNQVAGDVYDIQAASSYGPAGTNVAWNGTAWDALGGAFTIEECTNEEIDQIFTDLAAS